MSVIGNSWHENQIRPGEIARLLKPPVKGCFQIRRWAATQIGGCQVSLDFEQLLREQTPDAVVATGPDGRVLYWNKGAEFLFGYTPEEALGRTLEEIIVPPDRVEEEK